MPSKPDLPPIPPELDTPEFRILWDEWLAFRREKKFPVGPVVARRTLKKLAGWGLTRALAALDVSMEREWRGVYEGTPTKPPALPKTTDDIRRAMLEQRQRDEAERKKAATITEEQRAALARMTRKEA